MDWLKAQGEVLKQAAQQHVSEMMEDVDLVGDLVGKTLDKAAEAAAVARGTAPDERTGVKDVEFVAGPLGFTLAGIDGVLEGVHVLTLEPGGQAERAGIAVGDRLWAVSGYDLPPFEPGDHQSEEKASKTAKKWLKEMPRPGRLTFRSKIMAKPTSMVNSDLVADALRGVATEGEGAELDVHGLLDDEWEVGDDSQGEEPFEEGRPAASAAAAPLPPYPDGAPPDEASCDGGQIPQDEEDDGGGAVPKAGDESREDAEGSRAELQWERDKRRQLTGQLQEALQVRARFATLLKEANERLKIAEERERDLEEQVGRLRKACAGVESASHAKEETAQQRVVGLEEKIRSLTGELQEANDKATALEDRALTAERRADSLSRELQGFRDAHDAELELVVKGQRGQDIVHQLELKKLEDAFAEKERSLREEVEKAKQETSEVRAAFATKEKIFEAARTEVVAAQVEAAAARAEAAKAKEEAAAELGLEDEEQEEESKTSTASLPPRRAGSKDMTALYDRIDYLEKRCRTLQAKVKRQSSSDLEAAAGGGGGAGAVGSLASGFVRPSWEATLVQLAGPKVAAVAVLVYSVADSALKSFTAALLQKQAWLWIFYIHLVVLYTIAGSCYAETESAITSDPIDLLNKELTAAGAERLPTVTLKPP